MNAERDEDASARPRLACLDGEPAPADLGPSLRALGGLPPPLRPRLVELLEPCLEPLPPDQLESRVGRICRRENLDARLVPAFQALVFLLRSAAAVAATPEAFGANLAALGLVADMAEAGVALYREVRPVLRRQIAEAVIAAHGRVLTGIDWRIDTLGASNLGRSLDVPVALLTFNYVEGGRADRFTIQLLPEMVHGLRALCDHLLKPERS